MTKRTLRWLIFGALLAGVVALSVHNNLSNARLVAALVRGDDSAYAALSERQDAYNLFRTIEPDQRLKVADHIGSWRDPRGPALAVTLVRDPDFNVHRRLVESLSEIARRSPADFAEQMAAGSPRERSAVLEAASAAGDAALEIVRAAFLRDDARQNAIALAVRIGEPAALVLVPMMESDSQEIAVSAAQTLAQIGAPESLRAQIGARALRLYQSADTQALKDSLVSAVSAFPVLEAEPELSAILDDPLAPGPLKAAAIGGLAKLGRYDRISRETDHYDERVAEAAHLALGG